jgi:glycine cleavage system H protein
MRVYRGCVFPEGLLYAVEQDVWVRYDHGIATLGMTDPAQTRCGKFVSVRFKRVGSLVPKGKSYATIESAKWVGPFPAVLTGELLETNQVAFDRDILITNREPYESGWLVKVRPTKWDEERGELLDAAQAFMAYERKIEEWKINCMRCAD